MYVEWYVGTMVLKFCTIDIAQITFGLPYDTVVGNLAISPWLFLRNSVGLGLGLQTETDTTSYRFRFGETDMTKPNRYDDIIIPI